MKQEIFNYNKRISNARTFNELVRINKQLERDKIDESNLQMLRKTIMEAALHHWYRIMKIKYRRFHKKELNPNVHIEIGPYISYSGSELEAWALHEIYEPSNKDNRFIAAKFLKEYVPNRYEDLPGYEIKWFHNSHRGNIGIKRDIYYFITVKDKSMRHGKLRRCKVFIHRDYDRSPRVVIYDPKTGYYSE